MGRAPCCEKVGLKRGPWTPEEDQKLIAFVQEHGHGSWRSLPKNAGLLRCGKSCRLRWTNYLRPDIKRGKFSLGEEQTIIQLHALLGNRWSTIASHLPKRTDNEVKNYWNTHLRKRLLRMGIDPVTHKPKSDTSRSLPDAKSNSSTLSHMAQWESARLEAEARLSKESNMKSKRAWPGANFCSKPSSSVRTWNSQASDLPFQIDLLAANKQSSAAEDLLNTFQNWQKSLQGQAGLWPGNLSASSFGGSIIGKISNSGTPPHGERMKQASTTSTIGTPTTHLEKPETAAKSERKRLSWTDAFPQLCSSRGQLLDCGNVQVQKVRRMVGLPGVRNREQAVTSLTLSALHDLVFSEDDDSGPCPPSPLWSQSSGDLSKDLCKSESEGTPPTWVSASASSNILEDLRLACEAITSELGCGEFSPDMQMDFVDESRLHSDVVALPALNADRSAVLSELMNVDESPDYWNSILKQMMDSTHAQQIDTI